MLVYKAALEGHPKKVQEAQIAGAAAPIASTPPLPLQKPEPVNQTCYVAPQSACTCYSKCAFIKCDLCSRYMCDEVASKSRQGTFVQCSVTMLRPNIVFFYPQTKVELPRSNSLCQVILPCILWREGKIEFLSAYCCRMIILLLYTILYNELHQGRIVYVHRCTFYTIHQNTPMHADVLHCN